MNLDNINWSLTGNSENWNLNEWSTSKKKKQLIVSLKHRVTLSLGRIENSENPEWDYCHNYLLTKQFR